MMPERLAKFTVGVNTGFAICPFFFLKEQDPGTECPQDKNHSKKFFKNFVKSCRLPSEKYNLSKL